MSSWSRAAEDLVRSGPAASLQWEGVTLTTHFQPILRADTGACVGYEALLRATDKSGASLRPDNLLRQAASDGGLVALDRACRALHLRNFAKVDPGEGRLFLNVHPEAAIEDIPTTREFGGLIRYYGLVAKRLCIEISEDPCREGALVDAVAGYRELGVGIAMDHFGFGSSNLDRLAALRPALVKLQRAVIVGAIGASKADFMLGPVIRLLRDSGAQVAVEAVESSAHALHAIQAGAHFLQGNYLGSPHAGIGGGELGTAMLRRLTQLREPAAVGDD